MISATFQYSELRDACFASANLTKASLIHSSLERCLFHRASLFYATFFQSRIHEARFFRANLMFASMSKEQLDDTLGDINSEPPEGMHRPTMWLNRELTREEDQRYIVTS